MAKFLDKTGLERLWDKTKTYVDEHGKSGGTTYLVNAPLGTIVIWCGTEDSVPQGWSICNGENGTIDLSGKFVLAAGNGHEVGDTGGAEEVTLTVEQIPSHSHQFSAFSNGYYGPCVRSAAGSGAENPIMTAYAGGSQPHPNMPPYYTLLYIQKTGVTPTDYATEERVQEIVDDAVSDIQLGVTTEEMNTAINTALSNVKTEKVYSTEETRIGTWIDGKPLYRMVCSTTTPATTSDTSILNLPYAHTIIDIRGIITHPYNILTLPVSYSSTNTAYAFYNKESESIFMKLGTTAYTNLPIILIVEYTKTTDEATRTITFAKPTQDLQIDTLGMTLTPAPTSAATEILKEKS